jgi:predicted ATP-dependent serine protease
MTNQVPNLKRAVAKVKVANKASADKEVAALLEPSAVEVKVANKASADKEVEALKAAHLAEGVAKIRERVYAGSSILALPPMEWEIPGWLARNALTALTAPPKAGKSFIALHLAEQAAKGGRFAGTCFEQPLKVIYCAFEKYPDTRDRIEAIEVRSGESMPSSLLIYAPKRAPQLANSEQVKALEEYFREEQPQLVIIDTLARCTAGIEENSAKEIGSVIEILDRLRVAAGSCALVIVHHEGKDSSKGMRGSSALLGAVDQVIKVSGTPGIGLELRVTHSNAAEPPMPTFYKVTSESLDPSPGRAERRSVGVLESTSRPAIGTALAARIIEVLEFSYSEGATRSQITSALSEDLKPGEVAPSDKTVGAALTAMSKEPQYRLSNTGKGRALRWHYLPEPADQEEGGI